MTGIQKSEELGGERERKGKEEEEIRGENMSAYVHEVVVESQKYFRFERCFNRLDSDTHPGGGPHSILSIPITEIIYLSLNYITNIYTVICKGPALVFILYICYLIPITPEIVLSLSPLHTREYQKTEGVVTSQVSSNHVNHDW